MINLRVPLTLFLVWATCVCVGRAFLTPLPEGVIWLAAAVFAGDTARIAWRDGFWW